MYINRYLPGLRGNFHALKGAGFSAWQKPQQMQYMFSDVPLTDDLQHALCEVTTMLFRAKAFSATTSIIVAPHLRDWNQVLEQLELLSLVQRGGGENQWYVTELGLRKLEYGNQYQTKLPLCLPAQVTIKNPWLI